MPEMPEYDVYECSEESQTPDVEVLIADLAAYLGKDWRLEAYNDGEGEVFDLFVEDRPVVCGSPRAVLWQEVMALQSFFQEFDVTLTPKADGGEVMSDENAVVVASGSPGAAKAS